MQLFAFGKRISNLKDSIVRQTNDISRPSLIDSFLTLRHKLGRATETNSLPVSHMQVRCITDELARANLAEGNTTTMIGVDVGRYLEDKTCKLIFFGLHLSLLGFCRTRIRSYLHEAVQQFLNAKVVKGRTKEYRSHLSIQISRSTFLCRSYHLFYCRINALYHLQVFAQFCSIVFSHGFIKLCGIEFNAELLGNLLFVGGEEVQILLIDVINALEAHTLIDRPTQGTYLNLQFFFQFVQKVEGVFSFTVHLIDKDDNRSLTHTADRH